MSTTAPELDLTIPDSPAALEEFLTDTEKMKAIFKEKDGFKNLIQAYARVVMNKNTEIATQVKAEVDKVLADFFKEQKAADGAIAPVSFQNSRQVRDRAHAKAGLYNPQAMGAVLDKEFQNSSDFFKLIWHLNNQRDATNQAQLHRVRNAFSSTVPSEGGFLIPETLRSEILRVSLETSLVRPRARVIPMESLRVPFPAIDSTSNVSSVYGGINAYWTEEGATLTQSQASFGRVVLDAKKLTAYAEVPNELLSDSLISFQAFLDEIFPEALGFYEDYAFLRGSGVGEPLGVLNSNAAITVTENAANLIKFEDVVGMYSRMLPTSLGRAVWVASIDTFPQLAAMVVPGGAAPNAVWLSNGQVIDSPPMTIFGRPVFFTEKVPALGTTGALNFIDFGFYLIGDRQVMSARSSEHYKFGNDVTAYRIIQRVDGRPWLNSAITPKNGGATLSPVVKLLSA